MNAGGPARVLIDGRFELLERLGGGGMGLVWRARDTMLQREVALKEVRPAEQAVYDDDPVAAHVMRERVLREARALARLHHPNVVTIYHIVDSAEHRHPWLVMELVTGGSLDDRIKRGALSPQESAHIGRGVLAALRAAHAAGIQHRDVKPANVLLRPDGTPVLTDFGIAALRESSSLTATGALIGSPEYIAPERIRGQEGDPASDLWSLGMLMYVALEGHNPLRRDTTLATLAAVLDAQIPEPTHAGALNPVLRALLVRDAATRPDAATLDHMLAAAEHGAMSAMYGNVAASYVSPVPPFGPSGAAYGFAYGPASAQSPANSSNPADSAPPQDAFPSPSSGSYNPNASQQHPWATNGSQPQQPGAPRRRRTATFVASITGTAVIGLAAALVWTLRDLPASASTGNNPGTHSSTSASAGTGTGMTGTQAPSANATSGSGTSQSSNFLTPAGARAVVSALHQQFGSRKIVQLVLYPAYASVEVVTASDSKLYDEYWYRNGSFEHVMGGEITDEVPVDLSSINWDALPTLFSDARQQLNVPHPTSQYLIIEGNWIDQGPGLGAYLSDDYGGAYLLADLKGKVLKTYPRN
jgi:serine/threonine protein kinase